MNTGKKRGISLGTVSMVLLTVFVLVGYFMLLPTFTGNQDIRVDATKLAVAIDESISQLATSSTEVIVQRTHQPAPTIRPTGLTAAIVSTPQPVVPTTPPKLRFTFCATGSIILNNNVQQALTVDQAYRFDILTDQLCGKMNADLSIATLENTLIPSSKLTHLNMPVQMLSAIHSTGINALSLGHPNALNNGVEGLNLTAQEIQNAGMLPIGMNSSVQGKNKIINLNGVDVALLAYQDELSATGKKQTTENERNMAYSPIELAVIQADIASAKQSGAEVIVISLCWGKVGATSPTNAQIELAQAMADAGADIILGTHSGALQSVRVLSANRADGKYHPVLCAYSLGNLMTHDREKRSGLASILLKSSIVYDTATGCIAFENLSYTPTYAWRGKEDGRTRYRVLINDGKTYPDFVGEDQKGVMERCYTLVENVMAETGIPIQ